MQITKRTKEFRRKVMGAFHTEFLEGLFHWSTIVTAIFAGVSILAALISAFSGYEVSDRLQRESDEKISKANAQAEIAKSESSQSLALAKQYESNIASANLRAEEAKVESANANKIAESERIARLKLELQIAPRVILPSQMGSAASKLAGLAGVDVDIVSYESMGADVASLSLQVASMLASSKLNAKIYTPIGGGAVVHGLLIRTEMGSTKPINDAADGITNALRSVGLDVTRYQSYPVGEALAAGMMGPDSTPSAKLRILIGSKM